VIGQNIMCNILYIWWLYSLQGFVYIYQKFDIEGPKDHSFTHHQGYCKLFQCLKFMNRWHMYGHKLNFLGKQIFKSQRFEWKMRMLQNKMGNDVGWI
jgi:hypothetical protein